MECEYCGSKKRVPETFEGLSGNIYERWKCANCGGRIWSRLGNWLQTTPQMTDMREIGKKLDITEVELLAYAVIFETPKANEEVIRLIQGR